MTCSSSPSSIQHPRGCFGAASGWIRRQSRRKGSCQRRSSKGCDCSASRATCWVRKSITFTTFILTSVIFTNIAAIIIIISNLYLSPPFQVGWAERFRSEGQQVRSSLTPTVWPLEEKKKMMMTTRKKEGEVMPTSTGKYLFFCHSLTLWVSLRIVQGAAEDHRRSCSQLIS